MKCILTESQYKNIAKLLKESDWDEIEYYDVFMKTFKKYLQEKKNVDLEKFPFSFLIKKHFSSFVDDLDLEHNKNELNRWDIERLGRQLVHKGIVVIPSLQPKVSFMSKYKKIMDLFSERLNLPEYSSLEIKEIQPYKIQAVLNIDWEKVLKSGSKSKVPSRDEIEDELKLFLQNYLGLDIDSPHRGGVLVARTDMNYLVHNDWIKNEIVKKIKPEIKKLANSDKVKAIRVDYHENYLTLVIIFKSSYSFKYEDKRKFMQKARELLDKMGYSDYHIRLTY